MSSKSTVSSENLLDELQSTLAHGTVARRVETLRRVTDLFINGAVEFSNEQIALFDDVFQCLIVHIETSAKALLSNRLAPIDSAPPLTIRVLSLDDLIEVAGPVLSGSERLDDNALIETARTRSQAHLLVLEVEVRLDNPQAPPEPGFILFRCFSKFHIDPWHRHSCLCWLSQLRDGKLPHSPARAGVIIHFKRPRGSGPSSRWR